MEWMQKRVRDWREKVGLQNKAYPMMYPCMDEDEAKAFDVACEECVEFMLAVENGNLWDVGDPDLDELNLDAQAKEAADAIFTILGWACARGVDMEPIFAAVCDSNDTKAGEKDANGKVVKGDSYVAPDIEGLLMEQEREGSTRVMRELVDMCVEEQGGSEG